MDRAETRRQMALNDFQFSQKLEHSLAQKLELPELSSGIFTIRDEKRWRENEKHIEYIWIARISRSFVGFGGLVTVKFREHNFRDICNAAELQQGVFLTNADGSIKKLYIEKETQDFYDRIYNLEKLELFTANQGLTLDGVSYYYHIIADNINTRISVANPVSASWQEWETGIMELGRRLSLNSGNKEMIVLFE